MTPLLAALLWFAEPAPLDMPRAEAYLMRTSTGRMYLEDRFDELDLWTAKTVLGRWNDEDGRTFTLAKIENEAPLAHDAAVTRTTYEAAAARLDPKDEIRRDYAFALLSPLPLPEEPERPRQKPRGYRDVAYLHGTNTASLVCAFLPENPRVWHLAIWDLADGDDMEKSKETFEEEFLAKREELFEKNLPSEADAKKRVERRADKPGRRAAKPSERELLRADARHSVTNYASWRVTDAEEFSVLDDLPQGEGFIASLTNDLSRMRARYAKTVPSPLDGSNVLAVARIFRTRGEYLAALDDNDVEGMEWSAAYWDPLRRELVAYLPDGGEKELLKTIRHEAFHQYLSYACSMISASPWLNEGYAQYFEDESATDWGIEVDLEVLAEALPAIMAMDYGDFYSGTDEERRIKYRTAWSIAKFLEDGAPKVRFDPFKDVKRLYIEKILEHRDRRTATFEAFGTKENLEKFVSEWKKFWEKE